MSLSAISIKIGDFVENSSNLSNDFYSCWAIRLSVSVDFGDCLINID
jgi:hypothetical protein